MENARPPSPPAFALREELEHRASVLEAFRDADTGNDDLATARKRVEACIGALGGVRSLCDGISDDGVPPQSSEQELRRALFSVADSCFLAQCDLRPLVEHLDQAGEDDRDLIESVRRKVRRACNRVLVPLGPLVGRTANAAGFSQSVLETSLAVRRHYTRFRRALPRVDTSPQSVRTALAATLALVADVMRHVDASDIRIQDEMVFKSLQNRTAMWLGTTQSPESGRQLFTDVCTFAVELRRVNERRELRQHDAVHVANALTALDTARPNVEALATPMRALEGFDDELDRLFWVATRDRAPAAILGLRERLRAIRPQMR